MKANLIVWDLETVPDIDGFAAANDLVGKSDVEVREAIGDKFPKHIYHSIVCIGALIAHREPDCWAVDAVGAPHALLASMEYEGGYLRTEQIKASTRRKRSGCCARAASGHPAAAPPSTLMNSRRFIRLPRRRARAASVEFRGRAPWRF
jgi:hypothetical protein